MCIGEISFQEACFLKSFVHDCSSAWGTPTQAIEGEGEALMLRGTTRQQNLMCLNEEPHSSGSPSSMLSLRDV